MDDRDLREIFESTKVIAVVGLSPDPDRPSYRVAAYLQAQGYRIVPINPTVSEVLGEPAYSSLTELPSDIQPDVVDVFRKPEDVPPIADEAIARGAKVLWLQEGVVSRDAAEVAQRGGLQVIMDKCLLKEHQRLGLSE